MIEGAYDFNYTNEVSIPGSQTATGGCGFRGAMVTHLFRKTIKNFRKIEVFQGFAHLDCKLVPRCLQDAILALRCCQDGVKKAHLGAKIALSRQSYRQDQHVEAIL